MATDQENISSLLSPIAGGDPLSFGGWLNGAYGGTPGTWVQMRSLTGN